MVAAPAPAADPFHSFNNNASFSPAFQGNDSRNGGVLLGDLLTPEQASLVNQDATQTDLLTDSDTKDLSSSLARAAKSLGRASADYFCFSFLYQVEIRVNFTVMQSFKPRPVI